MAVEVVCSNECLVTVVKVMCVFREFVQNHSRNACNTIPRFIMLGM